MKLNSLDYWKIQGQIHYLLGLPVNYLRDNTTSSELTDEEFNVFEEGWHWAAGIKNGEVGDE